MTNHTLALAALLALAASACLDAGTGGRAITIDFAVDSTPAGDLPRGTLDTADGWRVTLDDAHVAFGPVYLYEKPGALAALRSVPSALSQALIPSAHAHAGDNQFAGGAVLGELAEYVVFDALSAEALTFEARAAVFGEPRSFSVLLAAEAVTQGSPLFGHQAFLRGTATRDDDTICLVGGTSPESDARREVNGLPFDGVLDDGATVTVSLHIDAWLKDARLDDLTSEDDDGCRTIAPGDPVAAAWSAALRSRASFSAALSNP